MVKLIKRKLAVTPDVAMLSHPRSIAAERFRRLKTLLSHDDEDGRVQVIVVSSAAPSEGKSLVSLNLALAFAADQQGHVLLLDADLRRPTIEKRLTPEPRLGLSEILTGQVELDHAVIELDNSPLHVLPAGPAPADPVELLNSDYARVLVSTLRKRYQHIIIDTPPIVPFADADVVGSMSDGVLIVARAGSTRRALLHQALEAVTSTRVLGTVLNDVTKNLADRGNYYYDKKYYEHYNRD
ncbi:MAG: CpsD/CapB family tyrosine-protein kinase [bacterium]|nr:CpsD/CapB family tyrosine-protein kinase [bacterium]